MGAGLGTGELEQGHRHHHHAHQDLGDIIDKCLQVAQQKALRHNHPAAQIQDGYRGAVHGQHHDRHDSDEMCIRDSPYTIRRIFSRNWNIMGHIRLGQALWGRIHRLSLIHISSTWFLTKSALYIWALH